MSKNINENDNLRVLAIVDVGCGVVLCGVGGHGAQISLAVFPEVVTSHCFLSLYSPPICASCALICY